MHPTITSAMRAIAFLLFAVLIFPGCNRKGTFSWHSSGSSSSDWTTNGKRTITRVQNGVKRKLETTTEVEIENGQVTKFPKAALVTMQESGGPQQREAELRENGGNLELWIKDKEAFRRGSPDEEIWLKGFLSEVITK